MAAQTEFFSLLESDHGFSHHLLPEAFLAGVGDVDLLFHRAQKPFVGRPCLAGHAVADLAAVEHRFDLVEVFLQQPLCLLLEGSKQGAVDVLLDPAVVKILAGRHQQINPTALLLDVDTRVGFDGILERE